MGPIAKNFRYFAKLAKITVLAKFFFFSFEKQNKLINK